ncbi:hypothetical protein KSP39_PZI011605 [Platanthera zijinensis]|uniref:Uncharacterized protein n=1 Tax=Platanthera zijinensis TaxID=2320716 RepID=A0AAP0BGH3_9ASPA
MNAVKAIHFGFPHKSSLNFQLDKSNSRRRSTTCFSNSEGRDSGSSHSEGDKQKQELLVQIAMIQSQKIRLVDFLDDRSAHLSQIAEDANSEFDVIGEKALKELDDAGSRIMEKLESRLLGFEESAEISRQEIACNEKALEEFEEQIVSDRNEGLFFKNLRAETVPQKADFKEEAQKLRQVAKGSAASRARRNIYLALLALMVLALGNAFVASPDVDWRKVGALLLIFVGLLAQFIYEQIMSSTADETTKEK